jgi:cell wall-associated NlpC family hydrolase
MDCSGAVYYLLRKVGIDPPRSAQAQYDWVKKSGKLTVVPPDAKEGDRIFDRLQPGDLLFWAAVDEAKEPRISHVQIYLGREIKDDLPVMIGASDGRSYRGTKKNGFGIVDFRVPKADSQRKLVGFGPPVWKKAAKTKA